MDSAERKRIDDEKAEYIRELERFQQFGVNLAFKPTMDLDLDKLRHEHDRCVANDTIVQRVTVMKIVIQFGAIGLEMLATKMKLLKLEGWSTYLFAEMNSGKHDAMLEQMYRQIWKRGAPNPWISFAALIIGSAIGFHFQFISLESVRGAGAGAGNNTPTPAPAPSAGPLGTGLSAMFGNMLGGLGGGGGGGGGIFNMLTSMVDSRRPVRGTAGPPQANPASPPPPPPPAGRFSTTQPGSLSPGGLGGQGGPGQGEPPVPRRRVRMAGPD